MEGGIEGKEGLGCMATLATGWSAEEENLEVGFWPLVLPLIMLTLTAGVLLGARPLTLLCSGICFNPRTSPTPGLHSTTCAPHSPRKRTSCLNSFRQTGPTESPSKICSSINLDLWGNSVTSLCSSQPPWYRMAVPKQLD